MLPKKNRISKKRSPSQIGIKRVFGDNLNLKISQNDLDVSRFSVVVAKSVSKKATIRNQIKREVRQFVRQNLTSIKVGLDVIIIIKNQNFNLEDVKRIFKKANIFLIDK
ncbi:MAG TPA: ribonuclease P protein component [Patescibacteria group bacterium]